MDTTTTAALTTPSDLDPLADVVPFLELPRHYPQFFAARHSAVWLLRKRDHNGLASVVRWLGRRAFISRADFAGWFHSRANRIEPTATQVAASRINLATARQVKTHRALGG